MKTSVLFVCLGNICRSPTAHGVFLQLLADAGRSAHIEVDSAGTGDWHVGRSPDPRMQAASLRRGLDLSALRARQVCAADFYRYDYILAMDDSNLADLTALQPADSPAKLRRFLDFARSSTLREVPDPYYGGEEGFDTVLDLVEDAAAGLLEFLDRQREQ